jgi:S-adenosylmethionine hydrolase
VSDITLSGRGQSATIVVGEHTIHGIAGTYAEGQGLIALFGSSGYLEISVANGSAEALLKAKPGAEVKIKG